MDIDGISEMSQGLMIRNSECKKERERARKREGERERRR
jgi:hypothetical protein